MHLQVQWATPTHVMELKLSLLFKAAAKAKAELRLRGYDEISEMHHFRKYGDFWLLHDSIQCFSDGSPRMSKCCTSGEQECVAKLLRMISIQTNSCIKTLRALLDAHKLKLITQWRVSRGKQVRKTLLFHLERIIFIKINRSIEQKANYKARLIPGVHAVLKNSAQCIVPDILRGLDHNRVPALIPSVLYKPAALL